MKNIRKYLIIILLLFISIGFAYLTTTLEINGIAGIGRNTWKIYFDNVVHLTGEDLATTKPTTSGTTTKSLTYRVNLNKPGDAYRFNVDIVNGGTIDAMISIITNTSLTAEQSKVISYSVTYADETPISSKNLLANNSSDKLLVSVIYRDDIYNSELINEDINIDIDLTIKYEQADSTAQTRTSGKLKVKFDYNNNLIGDIEDSENETDRAICKIKNNNINIKAKMNDAYIFLYSNPFYLQASKKYYFRAGIDGTWTTSDSQEIFIMGLERLNNEPFIHIVSEEKYFTSSTSEEYVLRFDVNKNETTHNFWNIFLTEYTESEFNVGANITFPTNPTRSGYTFVGWYTERVGGTQITTSTKVNYSTKYYAHWTEV